MIMKSFRLRCFYTVAIFTLYALVPSVSAYYTNMPASLVIGQQDFTSNTINQGGNPSASSLSGPSGVITVGEKLIITDGNNRRILIYNHIPSTPNAAADVVIGQPDFTSNQDNQGGSAGANTLGVLQGGLTSDGTRLIVADTSNHRVLIYNQIPTTNNASADVVIGQSTFSNNSTNQGGTVNANTLASPRDIYTDGTRLFISDTGNHRYLIFNTIPTTNNASADVVIGLSNFTTSGGCGQPQCAHNPAGISTDAEGKLYIADQSNGRIIIFNQIPTQNFAMPDVIVGKDNAVNLSDGTESNPPGANRLANPRDVQVHNGRLFISDWGNSRILIFNSVPKTNGAAADMVIGQTGFQNNSSNQGGTPTANTISPSSRIFVTHNMLFVADGPNHRVLMFSNEIPGIGLPRTITGQPDGKLRFQGSAVTDIINQTIKQVEYSINGSTWSGGFATDGKFESAQEDYYFDFDPMVNMMADNQGFTVKVRATHNNDSDTSNRTLYFEPFLPLAPTNNTFTLNKLPTFSFMIHSVRYQDLKENLNRFRIALSTDGVSWKPYVENIPVDYESVRLHPNNLRPNYTSTMSGTFEDSFKTIEYSQENSVITVTPKGVDWEGKPSDKDTNNGGTILANNFYFWRVEAIDNAGQIQYTEPRSLKIGVYQRMTTRKWFPLTLATINSQPVVDVSQSNDQIYDSTTRWPWFSGIATVGSTVELLLKKSECSKDPQSAYYQEPVLNSKGYCTRKYQTITKPNSTYTIPVSWELIPDSYEAYLSVTDADGNYNELPPFTLVIENT